MNEHVPDSPHPVSKGEWAFFWCCLAYFALKGLFFAGRIRPGIFPDESTHFGICELFSRSFLPPIDSLESFAFGLITHVPTFYYVLMGKVLSLNVFGVSNLIFLRIVNVFLGILTVGYAWKWIILLVEKKAVRLFFLVLLTHTLMFTFLIASVNYDNLVSLLAIGSLYYLSSFFLKREPHFLLLSAIGLLVGTLTKTIFIPYAFALVLAALFHERKRLRSLLPGLTACFTPFRWRNAVLLFLVLAFLVLNVRLYLGNWFEYGSFVPKADQVLTMEQAMENRIFLRDKIYRLYVEDKITMDQAQWMVSLIPNESDQKGVRHLLRKAALEKKKGEKIRKDRFRYTFPWLDLMLGRIFGIMGHESMKKKGDSLLPYFAVLIVSGCLMIRKFHPGDMLGLGKYLFLVAGVYTLVLMQGVNYKTYLLTGFTDVALQGRYLFPVLAPWYALISFYLIGPWGKRWQYGIAAVVGAFFVYGEFPWFLLNVPQGWFF